MYKSYLLLVDLSYAVGLIGLIELEERLEIANWLYGDMTDPVDPRGPLDCTIEFDEPIPEEDVFGPMQSEGPSTRQDRTKSINPEPEVLQFLVLKRWHFTVGDPDCVPSVPHGHENAKTQKWPKLNPYTGKVFSAMHSEDSTRRLSREEMKALWRNHDFVEHCLNQVNWYAARYSTYRFMKARRGYLAFPRW